MPRVIAVLFVVALAVYTFIDCARTPKERIPGRLPKGVWLALIVLAIGIGPLLWLFFKYQNVLTSNTPMQFPTSSDALFRRKNEPTGPVAPDDNADFLARLDAQNRRKAYEQRQAEMGNEKPRPHLNDDDDNEGGLYGKTSE